MIHSDKKYFEVIDHWFELFNANDLFPGNIEFDRKYFMDEDVYHLSIIENIHNDSNGTTKYFVHILIEINRALINDYLSLNSNKKINADNKVLIFIKSKLKSYVKGHIVKWVLTHKNFLD